MSTNAPVQHHASPIVDGPSDRDIMLSFMLAYDKMAKVNVKFMVQVSPRLTTPIIGKVIAVSYESGAKGQFIIELQAKNNTYEATTALLSAGDGFGRSENRRSARKKCLALVIS